MMKYVQKQGKESGKAQIAWLVVIALAAAAAGVWSELHAAPATSNAASNAASNGGSQIDVFAETDTNFLSGSISENGDGTATVSVNELNFISFPWGSQNLSHLSAFDPSNTTYLQTVNIKPGASGRQTGSGTGSATLLGDILDFSTFTDTPVTVSLQLGVDNTANQASAFNNHTLNVNIDPLTGKVSAARVVSVGTGAFGLAAGSISISVEGEVYATATGGSGQVQAFSNHSVTQIQ